MMKPVYTNILEKLWQNNQEWIDQMNLKSQTILFFYFLFFLLLLLQ